MAKSRPAPDTPPETAQSSPVLILIVGAIIVIALVAFSFSRSLRTPAAPLPNAEVAQQPALPQATSPTGQPGAGGVAVDSSLPPMASPRGEVPITAPPPDPADAPPTQAQLASVPRIEVGDLLQQLEGKQVTLIDVRDVDSYRARHIPGAMHIPLSFIAGEVPYLPKDKPIVTYCT